MSETINANVQLWRQKARDGTRTLDDARQAVEAIRKERMGAGEKSSNAKEVKAVKAAKAKSAPIDGDSLLLQFGIE
jgi:hypothetical protein